MKKLVKSIIVLATLVVMTLAMGAIVSATEAAVVVPEVFASTDQPLIRSYEYNQDYDLADVTDGVIVPLTVSKPGVVYIQAAGCVIENDAYVAVFTDAACTNTTTIYESIKQGQSTMEGSFTAPSAGTYYLRLWTHSYNEIYTNKFNLSFALYSTADKTVSAGKIYQFMVGNYEQSLYFKYKAKSTGYITVQTGDAASPKSVLTNASKKEITKSSYLTSSNNYAAIYAVEKGKTYYIKFSSMYSRKLDVLKITQKKVKEKSGKNRKKAVAVKAKKAVNGTIQYGEKKGDWYKLSLNKKKKLTIDLTAAESEYLKISVYDKKGKQISSSRSVYTGKNTYTVTHGTTYGKANKGTYYIKIERYNKNSSGYYQLKWK